MQCIAMYKMASNRTAYGGPNMGSRGKRAALYLRVSTDKQTVENQVARLTEVGRARGWEIVATFDDAGISGAKGRKGSASLSIRSRPGGASRICAGNKRHVLGLRVQQARPVSAPRMRQTVQRKHQHGDPV